MVSKIALTHSLHLYISENIVGGPRTDH